MVLRKFKTFLRAILRIKNRVRSFLAAGWDFYNQPNLSYDFKKFLMCQNLYFHLPETRYGNFAQNLNSTIDVRKVGTQDANAVVICHQTVLINELLISFLGGSLTVLNFLTVL